MDHQIRAIVVENEPAILRGICKAIETVNQNYTIIGTALDGLSAYREIVKNRPDVVFSDIMMPGMDGLELLDKLKQEKIHTKFVLITGYAKFEYAQKAVECGAARFLLKPINLEELGKCLEEIGSIIQGEQRNAFTLNLERQIFSEYDKHNRDTDLAEKVKKYLDAHITEQIVFGKMDAVFGYNVKYISNVFKGKYGISQGQYITNKRIHMAKMILEYNTEIHLKDVAKMVGYTDALYFSRVFKKATGMSPTDYQSGNANI